MGSDWNRLGGSPWAAGNILFLGQNDSYMRVFQLWKSFELDALTISALFVRNFWMWVRDRLGHNGMRAEGEKGNTEQTRARCPGQG